MLAKFETFTEFQPTKPLSYKIEQFLRQYNVTDYACNSFQDTLLLKAGITEDVKPLWLEFVKPDFVHAGMVVESAKLAKIEEFFKFLQQYDSTSTLEHIENNIYSIRMNASTCLEKITPVFEQAFLDRIQTDPNCLKFYQDESEREYAKFLKQKLEDVEVKECPSTLTSLKDHRDAFFSTANTPVVLTSNQLDSPDSFQLK